MQPILPLMAMEEIQYCASRARIAAETAEAAMKAGDFDSAVYWVGSAKSWARELTNWANDAEKKLAAR